MNNNYYMTGKPVSKKLGNTNRTNNTAHGRNGYHVITSTNDKDGTDAYPGQVYEYIEADVDTDCSFTNSLTGVSEGVNGPEAADITLTVGRYRWGLFNFNDIEVTSGKLICYLYDDKS